MNVLRHAFCSSVPMSTSDTMGGAGSGSASVCCRNITHGDVITAGAMLSTLIELIKGVYFEKMKMCLVCSKTRCLRNQIRRRIALCIARFKTFNSMGRVFYIVV